jgi:hypothetical protein
VRDIDAPLAYRFILRAYPRSFRERFGPEMAQLFLDRRRAGASGVDLVVREAVDCVRVAPRLHLENPMPRVLVPVALVATTVFGFVAAGPLGLLPALVLAVLLVGLRRERPLDAPARTRWWAWFAAAAVSAAVLMVVLAIEGDELTRAGWVIAFLSGNGAIVFAVIGVGNGVFRLAQHARTAAA